jgi:hypothetical protein
LLAVRMVADLWIAPPIVAIAGTAWLLARRPHPAPVASRSDGIALLLTALAAGPVFVSQFNIEPNGIGASVVERFYLLPELVVCIPFALGIDMLAARFERTHASDDGRVPAWTAILAMTASAAIGTVTSWPKVREHHRPTVELFARNTLDTAPPNAVILGTGDHRLYGLLYVQHALGRRPDVVYLDPNMWRYRWYRQRLAPMLGTAIYEPAGPNVSTVALAKSLLATGRPLLLANLFTDAITRLLPTYPAGTLIRVLPHGTALPPPDEVERINWALDASFEHEPTLPTGPGTWASDVQEAYARPWLALSEAFRAQGRLERADANRSRAAAAAPWLSPGR